MCNTPHSPTRAPHKHAELIKGNNMVKFYHCLYYKEYEAFGYRWKTKELPSWIKFTIKVNGDSKCLVIYSKIHKNKVTEMTPTYSNQFTDEEIIKDMSGKIASAFL